MSARYSILSAMVVLLVGLSGLELPCALSAEGVPSQAAGTMPVTCPAVELDEQDRPINGPFDSNSGPIQLVVLGTAKRLEGPDSRPLVYEVEVDKVLYGSFADKRLRIHNRFYVPTGERHIFALVPDAYGDPADYELRYHLERQGREIPTGIIGGEARLLCAGGRLHFPRQGDCRRCHRGTQTHD